MAHDSDGAIIVDLEEAKGVSVSAARATTHYLGVVWCPDSDLTQVQVPFNLQIAIPNQLLVAVALWVCKYAYTAAPYKDVGVKEKKGD
ncbi:hypothetical protein L6452_39873 [Arctium lappa]|uniref:Uncharacterized protein n=1 Tax=Arctium lappa TaxID=4217 RepID=A0ACB8XUD2_ARCLA|nr:hypothetical protein L6452_39873 [Arctium lappa]